MRIRVIRPFYLRNERLEVASEIDVDDALGREMVALQKAAPVSPMVAPVGPMTTESAAGIVAGRKRKGV